MKNYPPTPTDAAQLRLVEVEETVERKTLEEEFEEWYAAYPRKVGKGQAREKYSKARKLAGADQLLAAVKAQRPVLLRRGPEFCPHPATWLNGERWDDDYSSPPSPARSMNEWC